MVAKPPHSPRSASRLSFKPQSRDTFTRLSPQIHASSAEGSYLLDERNALEQWEPPVKGLTRTNVSITHRQRERKTC